jgi:hypothetical protein
VLLWLLGLAQEFEYEDAGAGHGVEDYLRCDVQWEQVKYTKDLLGRQGRLTAHSRSILC